MSQNLNLLRQKYCRPAFFTGKRTDHLFPIEEECEQGKALLAKAPKTLLQLQEFDPYGLQQTYRDEASGAELPVFAVFDLEGSHQLTFEITTDSLPTTNQPKSLPEHLPFQKTQASVRKLPPWMPVFQGESTANRFYPPKYNDFRFTKSAVPLRDPGLPRSGSLGSATRRQSDPGT